MISLLLNWSVHSQLLGLLALKNKPHLDCVLQKKCVYVPLVPYPYLSAKF